MPHGVTTPLTSRYEVTMGIRPFLSAALKRPSRVIPEATQLPTVSTVASVSRQQVTHLSEFTGISTAVAPILIHNEIFPSTVNVLNSPHLPIRTPGVVHVSQSWRLFEPVPVDGQLALTTTIVDFLVVQGEATITVASTAEHGGGLYYLEVARYRARRTGLPDAHVQRELAGQSGVIDLSQVPRVADLRDLYGLNERGRLDVGQASALAARDFGAGSGRAWAKLSGDINPIHLARITAIPFGYRRPILHGGAVQAWVEASAGITGDMPASAAHAFRAPLQLPNSVEAVALGDGHIAVLEARTGRDLVHVSASMQAVPEAPTQIVFPRQAGRRSSTTVSRGMFEAAAYGHGEASRAVESVANWRKDFRDAVVAVTAVDDPARGPDAAQRGLEFISHLRTADGRTLSTLKPLSTPRHEGVVIAGSGRRTQFGIPYQGKTLTGSALLDQVATWAGANLLTSATASRLAHIGADPDRLDLRGRKIGVLGAGAELSPTRFLLACGAEVFAVIRPNSPRLAALRQDAMNLPGTLQISPIGDVVENPEAVAGWLLQNHVESVIDTLYAPGAQNLLATIGSDVVMQLVATESEILTGWLGSPMDAYVLPADMKPGGSDWQVHPEEHSRSRIRRGGLRKRPAMVGDVYNGLLTLQGPNYAAAKRIGRWRATVRWAEGQRVSYHIAPMAQTHSVIDTGQLRAAYRGMEKMGISPFPADTTSGLMGALIAADIVDPRPLRADFLVREAFPTGLWAINTEPESLLVKAMLLGSGAYLRR